MKQLVIGLIFATTILGSFGQERDEKFETLMAQCSTLQSGNYKVMPYLQLAAYMQSLEITPALKVLSFYSKTRQYEEQMIVLIRMLFCPKPGAPPLRRPMLGAPDFMGGTGFTEWVTEPIILTKKVPFLIVTGYSLGGQAETSLSYLQYTMEFGQWNTQTFDVKQEELRGILDILIASSVWKTPLTPTEIEFLEKQILP
jgi:hypothetical protein